MRKIRIRKKSGEYRIIFVPDSSRKNYLKNLLPELNEIQENILSWRENLIVKHISNRLFLDLYLERPIVHGFFKNRDVKTNAEAHLFFLYSLSLEYLYLVKKNFNVLINQAGYELNKNKIRLQSSKFGNRVITGISVGEDTLRPKRSIRKKLRAAIHQENLKQAKGILAWSKYIGRYRKVFL